ncbi:MAG: PDDEXK nuclease domain-containing protein [Deltaproteobacteria bacterium]|nr:PDDEXK nuclease domain-containing protein [Deltaproteobacteria bacterium]
MNFNLLLDSIKSTHLQLQDNAAKAVNKLLTVRNWLIGYYIVEYEQKGEDRAQYGEKLLEQLARNLNEEGLSFRNLKLFRQFYVAYPQIGQTVIAQFQGKIGQTASAQLFISENRQIEIRQSATAKSFPLDLQVPPEKLISRLSFSHITLLLTVDDPLKRTFYEIETIKGNWSVRELKRQISSLYFERMGMSQDKEKLARLVKESVETPARPSDYIKNIYTFEFLGLPQIGLVEESDLEQAMLDHLQGFLLEMGHGFCLEGRQKRILIGDEYLFVDLVFYHRILKCHVLVELKVEEFNHINAGQLNTYLNYFKAEVMRPDDNPPVGILLVTNKNDALVQYATAGMDNALFVSRYMVELPSKEQLENFIRKELEQF